MKTVIIKYNSGNICSVLFALERIGVQAVVSDDPAEITTADRVIFPGVGEASSAMQYLRNNNLDKVITSLTQPVLGICLGMQLMCSFSEENNVECMGIFDERVRHFPQTEGFKIPQIGWNSIGDLKSPLFDGLPQNSYMYFVHGYFVEKCINAIATTNYITEYCSALQKNNFYAVQFHPEKSGTAGQQILKNFIFNIE
jgi:imidazole glycerol phosphate synthase, glutamine amidotransferase subunit